MKPEEIIELAKKAGWYISFAGNVFSPHIDADTPVTFEIERLLALHREALIASGELVPREKVEADKRDAELYRWLLANSTFKLKCNTHHGLKWCVLDSIPWVGDRFENKPKNLTEAIDRARSQP